MSWNLLCPFCQTKYKIEPEHQGTVCQCVKCGKEFTIPDDVQAWLGRMPDPPGSKRSEPERRAIAPDPADDDPVDRRDDPLDERNRDFHFCPDCGKRTFPFFDYCSFCGYSFWEKKSRDKSTDNRQFRYCWFCGRKVRSQAKECPGCDSVLFYSEEDEKDIEDTPQPSKPFLCGVLNVIGGFAVALCGLALIIQLVAAGVEFFHPSEHSYIREQNDEFYKTVMIEFAIFFGGMVVLGISQAVAQASRRW